MKKTPLSDQHRPSTRRTPLRDSRSSPVLPFVALLATLQVLPAADETWDGDTDGAWATLANWVGDLGVPGTGDIATFNSPVGTGGASLIDLGTAVSVDQVTFDTANVAGYTIGIAGTDTLTLTDNGNTANVSMTSAVAADQTIAADILLGPDATINDTSFDVDSLTNKLIITGNIDTAAGGTAGIKRLEFGDFGGAPAGETIQFDGTLSNTGGATRIEFYIAGADLLMNGQVAPDAGNTMRSIIRLGNTATVSSTGRFGRGLMEVRYGTLNLNTDLQQFDSGLNFGSGTQGDGNATVNIGAANTLALNSTITYVDDNNTANTGTMAGGILQATSANRAIIVHNNSAVAASSPELTISSAIVNDGSDRDLIIRGADNEAEGGTLRILGTNTTGGVTLQGGTLQLGHPTGSLDDDFLSLTARNNAATAQGTTATVDLLGNDATITGLTLGANGVNNIAGTNGFTASVVDSVGGGALTLNNITYRAGTTAGKYNGAATVSANLMHDGNRSYTIDDNPAIAASSPELTISGDISDDNDNRDITTLSDGTLLLSGNNTHDRTTLQNALTILGSGTAFGTGDGVGAGSVGDGRVFLQHYNGTNAAIYDGPATLDINGQEVILTENLVLGSGSTNNVANLGSHQVIDSAGGGVLVLSGTNGTGDNNNINNNVGSAGFENKTAIISADIRISGSSSTFTANDAADAIDIDISGTISSDNAGGRTLSKGGPGVLRLSASDNFYDLLNIQRGTVIITNAGALGDNDITLGNNNTDGILEYTGSGDVIPLRFRLGDNNGAATRTGGGAIVNNGTGSLTLGNATFNVARPAVTVARTLTLEGTSDGVISGAIVDNNTAGGGTTAVTKTGTNTWVLNGDNSYTGPTTVSAGRLDIGGTNTSAITVASNADLGGEGSTTGAIVFQGTHNLEIDATTAAALGSTGAGSLDVSAATITVDVSGTVVGPVDVMTFGTGGLTGGTGNFVLGTHTASGHGVVGFASTATAVTLDLGFVTNTWQGTDGTNPGFWDIGTTGNWSAADTFFFDVDDVIFGDTAGNFNPTLQGNITVGTVTFSNDATTAYTINDNGGGEILTVTDSLIYSASANSSINAVIAGSGSLYKGDNADGSQESFTLTLSAANTYSGGTTIDEGRIAITHNSALGTGTVTMSDGAGANNQDPILDLDQASGFDFTNDFVISAAGGSKIIRFNNGGTNTGTLSGAITQSESGLNSFRLDTGVGETLTVTGEISGAGNVMKDNNGTLILANTGNSFTGDLVAAQGILQIASLADTGVASAAGAGDRLVLGVQATGAGNDSEGTLSYTGSGASTDRRVQVTNYWFGANENDGFGGTISNDGTGPLTFTNSQFSFPNTAVAARVGPATLTLAGAYAGGANVIQGAILDNAPSDGFVDETVGIDVNTAGTWQLDGVNTYTGPTTVTAGTLLVNGSTSVTAAVTVDGGTLGGSGTVGGSVDVNAAGHVAPGASGGTLTITGGLNISAQAGGAGTLDFELDALAGSNDLLAVGGSLTIGSGVLGFSDFTFADLGGIETGTYTLVTSTGLTGTLDPADTTGLVGNFSFNGELQINGNNLELVVTASIYSAWAVAEGLSGTDARTTADIETPTPDELENLLEFGFGTDPNASDNLPLTVSPPALGAPRVEEVFQPGQIVVLRYVRRKDRAAAGLTYIPEFVDSTGTFYEDPVAGPATVAADVDLDYEIVEVPFPLFDSTGKKAQSLLGRVRVEIE